MDIKWEHTHVQRSIQQSSTHLPRPLHNDLLRATGIVVHSRDGMLSCVWSLPWRHWRRLVLLEGRLLTVIINEVLNIIHSWTGQFIYLWFSCQKAHFLNKQKQFKLYQVLPAKHSQHSGSNTAPFEAITQDIMHQVWGDLVFTYHFLIAVRMLGTLYTQDTSM